MFEAQALLRGPADTDVEEWPLLELVDVSVVRYRRGCREELVDLFDVVESTPFRVKGRLNPIPRKHKNIGSFALVIPGSECYRTLILAFWLTAVALVADDSAHSRCPRAPAYRSWGSNFQHGADPS